MLTGTHEAIDGKSNLINGLLAKRGEIKADLDAMAQAVETSIKLSDDATKQLAALHREYDRAKSDFESELSRDASYYDKKVAEIDSEVTGKSITSVLSAWAAVGLVPATGGASLLLLGLTVGAGGLDGQEKSEKIKSVETEKSESIARIKKRRDKEVGNKKNDVNQKENEKENILKDLNTNEQKRLYFGVVSEVLLDNGINIARQFQQYAGFNGISLDDVFSTKDAELKGVLDRLFKGMPTAADIERLTAISDDLANKQMVTPEMRTLKQFINHVVIPNKQYFDILASFSDDIRAQDLSVFPPLEILGQKPITLSGRITPTPADPAKGDEMLDRAKAKVAVRKVIAGNAVYEILKASDKPHVEKMAELVRANDTELQQYEGMFAKIEQAIDTLQVHGEALKSQAHGKQIEITDGTKSNKVIDGRIYGTNALNQAKQKAATTASRVRGGLALAGGIVLAMVDGGAASVPLAAEGAKSLFRKKVGDIVHRSSKDALHSVTFAVGQEVGARVENAALDDYMFSLMQQKVDVGALQTELKVLETAIADTQQSQAFQALLKDEAKRSQVAETLLLCSLIRNGYNNSLEFEEICNQHGVESVDAFFAHYEGTRLGLALKKHCHGIADSNDMAIILAEANCLRGQLSGADATLKEYVEDVLKPNVASFFSKASKMDVISVHNMTGFGNELSFSAEMQLENSRAIRLLLASEFGMSVVGREDVRGMFDYPPHRHGDRRLYDEKIRDGEMSDEYPDKRVSCVSHDQMERFVDMAKRSVASGRTSFPKVGDMFMRVCAYEYFQPQAVMTGGKDNIFTDHPQSPSAYPLVNTVVHEFIKKLEMSGLDEYRDKVGLRLDNVIASTFFDFFARLGDAHKDDPKFTEIRTRVKDAANYDDYAPVFDRYVKSITRDAVGRFDMFLELYKHNLQAQMNCSTDQDRAVLEEQIVQVKDIAGGKLSPAIIRPDSHEARMRAQDELHTGANMLRRG